MLEQINAKGCHHSRLEMESGLSRKRKKFKMSSPLTFEEEKQLSTKIQQGDEKALLELFEKNIPLAQHIANSFYKESLDNESIFSEALIGLYEYAKKFDCSRGIRFSSWASINIKGKIKRFIATKSRIINPPEKLYPMLCKFLKHREELRDELCREPSYQELELRTGFDSIRIKQFALIADYTANSPIKHSRKNNEEYDDDSVCENEYLVSQEKSPLDTMCEQEELYEVREAMIEKFKDEPRTLEILKRRMGFINNRVQSLSEIGKSMNLSHEAIRLIEKKALEKLRRFISEKQLTH